MISTENGASAGPGPSAGPGTTVGRVEKLLQRDRMIVALAVCLIVFIAGLYTYAGVGMDMTAADMTRMAGPVGDTMSMGPQPVWTVGYATLIFFMWWVMMIAMMTPSAAPMVLLYTAVKRLGPDGDRAVMLSLLFLCGYLAAWAVFSALATGLQFGAQLSGLLDGTMMTVRSRTFAGILFICAGGYQLSGLKDSCLRHCRSPAHFLAEHRRPGAWGAVATGARHGVYCLGCCWALMALLFVGGIMNLYWIAGIALYVFVEKAVAKGRLFARVTGAGLALSGMYLLAA